MTLERRWEGARCSHVIILRLRRDANFDGLVERGGHFRLASGLLGE